MRRISSVKRKRIIDLYFRGRTFSEISKIVGVAKSTVSEEVSRFVADCTAMGSLDGGSEGYGVEEQIKSLRELALDLKGVGATVKEAKRGIELLKKLKAIGVQVPKIASFVKLCEDISPKGFPTKKFVKTAMDLWELKKRIGIPYDKVLESYERDFDKARKLDLAIAKKNKDLKELHLKAQREKAKADRYAREHKLTLELVKQVFQLRRKLQRHGIDIDRVDRLVEYCAAYEKLGLGPEKVRKLADLDALLASVGVTPEKVKEFVEFHMRLRSLGFDRETAEILAKELKKIG